MKRESEGERERGRAAATRGWGMEMVMEVTGECECTGNGWCLSFAAGGAFSGVSGQLLPFPAVVRLSCI